MFTGGCVAATVVSGERVGGNRGQDGSEKKEGSVSPPDLAAAGAMSRIRAGAVEP